MKKYYMLQICRHRIRFAEKVCNQWCGFLSEFRRTDKLAIN